MQRKSSTSTITREYKLSSDADNSTEAAEVLLSGSSSSSSPSPDLRPQTSTSLPLTQEERKKQFIRNACISSIFVLLWYTFSISLSMYNKWMFSEEGLNFNFPVLTTSMHQVIQFLLSMGLLIVTGKFNKPDSKSDREDYEMLSTNNNDRSRGSEVQQEVEHFKDIDDEGSDDDLELMSSSSATVATTVSSRSSFQKKLDWFKLYLISIVPCAFATANDIGMGNVSLRFVTLTFYTMVKSSSLAWVLLFGILFKLEVPTRKLVGIIGIMTIGVVMMVAGEAHFVLVGFLLVLGAAVFSGLRWSLTQILLRNSGGINTHNDPVRTIMYISPIMALLLFAMGGILEGYGAAFRSSLWSDKGIWLGIGIVVLPGVLAFLMTLSEFMLLGRTSVLTLSIAGIFKELVTIVSASLWFHDRMTLVNFIGLVITLTAIVAYNIYRYRTTVV